MGELTIVEVTNFFAKGPKKQEQQEILVTPVTLVFPVTLVTPVIPATLVTPVTLAPLSGSQNGESARLDNPPCE